MQNHQAREHSGPRTLRVVARQIQMQHVLARHHFIQLTAFVEFHHRGPTANEVVVKRAPRHDQHSQQNKNRLNRISDNHRAQPAHHRVHSGHHRHDHHAGDVIALIDLDALPGLNRRFHLRGIGQ